MRCGVKRPQFAPLQVRARYSSLAGTQRGVLRGRPRREQAAPAARARPPGVALAPNPVGMSPRADVVEGLKDARFSVHIVKELVDAVGWPLEAIVDVLNDEEEGPERLQRAYSFLESCPADIGRGERTQILENILRDKKGGPPETDDEGDEDEGEADNERGDLDEDF